MNCLLGDECRTYAETVPQIVSHLIQSERKKLEYVMSRKVQRRAQNGRIRIYRYEHRRKISYSDVVYSDECRMKKSFHYIRNVSAFSRCTKEEIIVVESCKVCETKSYAG